MILRRLAEGLVALALAASPAAAADLGAYRAEELGTAVAAGECADPGVLGHIIRNFAWAERHTWGRGFEMAALENPRFRYDDLAPTMIPKRRCMAEALMTNGVRGTVYYQIEERMGLASIGRGISYCVVGLDPWHIYDEACRTLR